MKKMNTSSTSTREYELVLLLSPDFSETEAQEYIETIKKDRIESESGKITFEDFWGRQTLAYPIKKQTAAVYAVIAFTFEGAKIKNLEEEFRIDKKIIRHLISLVEKNEEKMTKKEIDDWNRENLPEEKKKKGKAEEKRAPLKSRGKGRKSPPSEPVKVKTEKEDGNLDKKKLDKKLDEILEGDLDI